MTDVVGLMNDRLEADDDRLTAPFTRPAMPVSFILSQARAASTLFIQIVASCYRVGYVTNLLARYSRAPYIGALLQRSLEDPDFKSTMRTDFVTSGPAEPHEWGWFWSNRLRLQPDEYYVPMERPVDIGTLASKIAAIETALGAPLLFDNIFAQCNLGMIEAAIGEVVTVRMRREPYYVCNSILNARLRRHGDLATWYGNRTRDHARIGQIEDPVQQVVEQVWSTEEEINALSEARADSNRMDVEYEELVASPLNLADRFAALLASLGAAVEPRPTRPDITLTSRNNPDQINPDFRDRLTARFAERFGYLPAGVA
jgi:hypothetical protein